MFQFSLLLPTRGRPKLVDRFFQSILDTASCIEDIEIVLCLDEDDLESQHIFSEKLSIRKVILPKGSNMGILNRVCFEASSGRYVMLINDDVIIRTKVWDKIITTLFSSFQDDVALIHVNDLLFGEDLCTFPILSRKACLEVGVCPAEYRKYRIDDHIYDTFQMLAYLGHKRILYLADVVFEHDNKVRSHQTPSAQVFKTGESEISISNKEIIESDGRIFDDKLEERKQNALKLAYLIDQSNFERKQEAYGVLLNTVKDPYSYRRKDFVRKIRLAKGDLRKLETVAAKEASGGPKGVQESIMGASLIKLGSLINPDRGSLQLPNRMTHVLEKAFSRYYNLPRSVRWATDGIVSRLVRLYRAIHYSQKN
jgi:glycosyltransferase involved in cell wall biosynthesis